MRLMMLLVVAKRPPGAPGVYPCAAEEMSIALKTEHLAY